MSTVVISVHGISRHLMFRFIGQNGINIKLFRTKYGLQKVWWDQQERTIILYGESSALLEAFPVMNRQIESYRYLHEIMNIANNPEQLVDHLCYNI